MYLGVIACFWVEQHVAERVFGWSSVRLGCSSVCLCVEACVWVYQQGSGCSSDCPGWSSVSLGLALCVLGVSACVLGVAECVLGVAECGCACVWVEQGVSWV